MHVSQPMDIERVLAAGVWFKDIFNFVVMSIVDILTNDYLL